MVYSGEHGTVNFWGDPVLSNRERVWLSLSGGTDSALVFYMLCNESTVKEITPFTAVEKQRPVNIYFVEAITEYFREKYPEKIINDVVRKDFVATEDYKKPLCVASIEIEAIQNQLVDVFVNGMTSNPSKEVMEENGMLERHEDRRSEWGKSDTIYYNKQIPVYRPLIEVTKLFVSEMYKRFNLMEDLYPLTSSCVGYEKGTKKWTVPCRKCFWCNERLWAFGTYDLKNWLEV